MTYYNKILKPNEAIIHIVKKYFFTYVGQLIVSLVLISLPFFLLYPLFGWGKWGIILFVFLLVIGLISFVRLLINYSYNSLIITNNRLIYYQQKGFFQRFVSEVFLEKVQDISYERKGLWQTLFKYGNLNIQVINSNTIIKIIKIKSPALIQNLINDLKENYLQNPGSLNQANRLQEIISELKDNYGDEEIKKFF